MRRLAIPCAIVLALSVPALGQDAGERGYSNAVLAGRTETGEDVVLIAGRHQGFPFGGIDWDNVLLKVGSKAYRFTEIDPDDDRTLYMNVGVTGGPQGRPPDATISFAGTMEAFDVAAGVPKRAGSTPVALSVTTRIDPLAPKPVLEWVRRLDRKTPLMILDVFRMHDGEWSMDVGGVVHKIAPATVSGHIETTRNSSLNGSVNQPAYLLYDYAAGARPNDAGRSPAWTNGRLVTPFGGAPISVPLSVSGSLQPILSRRTLLTSRVPLAIVKRMP